MESVMEARPIEFLLIKFEDYCGLFVSFILVKYIKIKPKVRVRTDFF